MASLVIVAVIVVGTWNLFRQSLRLLFDGVPEGVDLHAVRALLQALPGVAQVHDLHVWAIATLSSPSSLANGHLTRDRRHGLADMIRRHVTSHRPSLSEPFRAIAAPRRHGKRRGR